LFNYFLLHSYALSRAAVTRALETCYCDPSLVTPEVVDAYRDRLLIEGLEDAYYGLMAPVDAPAPDVDFSRIEAPTLAIWGDQDRVIPLEDAQPLVDQIPDLRLVTLDRCGHAPMEEYPGRFLDHVLPFLLAHRQGALERSHGSLRMWWRRQVVARLRGRPKAAEA
jgi:pimeloyl-ACP methyl ester carboxylesterase